MELTHLKDTFLGTSKKKYSLERVDIISPYLSDYFFKKLKKIKPKKIFVVTDAGCSPAMINDIKDMLEKKLDQVKLAQCAGIVHAKCYLFHWKNRETNRFKRLLLWGSCNATDGGFEKNAEIFSWLNLSSIDAEQRKCIIGYFKLLSENDDGVDGVEIKIRKELHIKFPNIKFYTSDSSTFDIWVQRGNLCHPFPNDPSFRHLRVVLKNKIAPEDELTTALMENNIEVNQQATITYDYLRQNIGEYKVEEDDDNFTSTWKSKYFVDTVYGLWTSSDCFAENKANFHKTDIAKKEIEINKISAANTNQRRKWAEEFLVIIKAINERINDPENYFYYKDGKFDVEKYRTQFVNQLNRDFVRSKDSWFKRGYISGYDFPEVPPIREFSSNWNEFISSLSESLFFEVNKSGTRSWLALTVRDCTAIGAATDTIKFLDNLRRKWSYCKESIECFYCTE